MSEPKHALALHLAGNQEPFLIAVSGETAAELSAHLVEMIRSGEVETITALNGAHIAVHFGQVHAAHVDEVPHNGGLYGAPPRER